MKVDVIHTTVGSREHYEDGRVRYISAPTEEGWCYKDDDAWDKGDICYIPESEFEFTSWRESQGKPRFGYSKEDIVDAVRYALEDWQLAYSEDFLERKAKAVYDVAEWESIGVVVDRIDWEEELNEFNMKED